MDASHVERVVLNALRLAARTFAANAKNPHLSTLHEAFKKDAAAALLAAELIDVGEIILTEKRLSSTEQEVASRADSDNLRATTTAPCSATSSSPLTGEHADDAPRRAAIPAVAGNNGGVPFADVLLGAMADYNANPGHFYECAHGFSHRVGQVCNGECVP